MSKKNNHEQEHIDPFDDSYDDFNVNKTNQKNKFNKNIESDRVSQPSQETYSGLHFDSQPKKKLSVSLKASNLEHLDIMRSTLHAPSKSVFVDKLLEKEWYEFLKNEK